ncbi:flagellar basal body P-ring formation chaperone FlgA [Roseitranquillus sediminis]|uniref:flagellar basal body P-ring formation chaperone FlgA n=1 Tax=Roseitranquillus sediminis TaxID=2809051 RepID=UPI001D0C6DD8|nr:flagellar basal body P-ring formation chaperone FlgA [Roseitranquillus sediminis]MBM9596124.1 flagellar basal body P-ring formation protein FlgA [Roseitranquillus sediminis]
MKHLALAFALALPAPAHAETVVAAHTIRSQSILTAQDVTTIPDDTPGALTHVDDAVGMEARVNLYAGRPIRYGDIGPAAIVDRNQIVTLVYDQGGLSIATEGRSLGRGGVGDRIRVMNLSSRATVNGTIASDGTVRVTNGPLDLASR